MEVREVAVKLVQYIVLQGKQICTKIHHQGWTVIRVVIVFDVDSFHVGEIYKTGDFYFEWLSSNVVDIWFGGRMDEATHAERIVK